MDKAIIFKNKLPIHFFLIRWLLVFSFILMILVQANYLLLLILIIPIVTFIGNENNYIIEVYDDFFKLILPSFYGKKFQTEDIYYYKDIESFTFTKGEYNWFAAFIGELISFALPPSLIGFFFAYKKPKIVFVLIQNTKKFEIEIVLKYNQIELVKAIELIQKKIKK